MSEPTEQDVRAAKEVIAEYTHEARFSSRVNSALAVILADHARLSKRAAELEEAAKPKPIEPERNGRHSDKPCRKCGALEVYVLTDDDSCDLTIECRSCWHIYRVDGADS